MRLHSLFIALLLFIFCNTVAAQQKSFTRSDTLRGSNGAGRNWWNVRSYDITITPSLSEKTIKGNAIIHFQLNGKTIGEFMQIDLQTPMEIDAISINNKSIKDYTREGNVYWIKTGNLRPHFISGQTQQLNIQYHGKPLEAKRAPWDGGTVWKQDANGNPWFTIACEGVGASLWFPCKDYGADEAEKGAVLTMIVPDTLSAIAGGRLESRKKIAGGYESWTWRIKASVNNYNIIPSVGKYVHWKDTLMGEKGKLDLDYWVIDHNLEKSKQQFQQVKPMLRSMEYWFGPYPFYEDGFKLIDAPHLGMEHQSGIAYGNQYKNGYMGRDLSESGWGLKWDFIIVHESGHEWFGNNVTVNDAADMWIQEGITDYSETLFTEYYYGKEAGDAYLQGLRRHIANKQPMIGAYGVNYDGDLDIYYKGASLMHTIRQIINNDVLFRKILRGIGKQFYHQTVDSRQIEAYINTQSGKNLKPVFDQYLRYANLPVLEYRINKGKLSFRWAECIDDFTMPLRTESGKWLYPTTQWKTIDWKTGEASISIDKNFYITIKKKTE